MENGTAVQYVPMTANGTATSPGVQVTTPTLPPLIKIDQTIPVGYPTTTLMMDGRSDNGEVGHQKNSDSRYRPGMTSDPGQQQPHPHFRPTIINLVAPPTSVQLPAPSANTPQDSAAPRLLVEPVDSDRPERMRDWLVRMIDSGRFPGLKWLDQEQMIFRVPWIHAKKRDYNQERDAALFREWAIHSGKYGDGSDVTTWKINFRCALNGLKDIIERRELEEPDCRVYQMLPSSSSARRRKRRRPMGFHGAELQSDMTMSMLSQGPESRPRMELPGASPIPAFSSTTIITPTSGPPIQVVPLAIPAGTPLTPIATPINTPAGTPIRLVGSPTTPQNPQIGFIQKLKTVVPSNMSPVVTKHFDLTAEGSVANSQTEGSQPPTPRTPISPIAVAQFSPRVISPPQQQLATTINNIPSHPPIHSPAHHTPSIPSHATSMVMYPTLRTGPVYCPPTEFCSNPKAVIVRVLYGSITVHLETLDCSKGARLYYGPLHCRDILEPQVEEKLFGPLEAQQIPLSPRHPASLAKEIFSNFKRGLILEVKNECVYARALCRTVVYYGSSPLKHTNILQKEERTKVFNYPHQFTPSFKYTAEGRGQPPKPYVVFSLGQPWSAEKPLARNLVTVVVTYCKALNDLRVRNVPIYDELLFEAQEARDIRIIAPTPEDMEAEQFLNPKGDPSTPH